MLWTTLETKRTKSCVKVELFVLVLGKAQDYQNFPADHKFKAAQLCFNLLIVTVLLNLKTSVVILVIKSTQFSVTLYHTNIRNITENSKTNLLAVNEK